VFDWWRKRRLRQLAAKRRKVLEQAKTSTELREFVYLDDTSVNSLIASRLGPIASEQTDVQARNWETKGAGKVAADLAVFDVEGSIERMRASSLSTQVLKKSIVQTTFKDLLELERDSLLLRSSGEAVTSKDRAGVSSKDLIRGALVELDVELDVEPIFRMATVVSSLVGIVDKSPELFDESMQKQFAQGRAVQGILQAVLGGLVPIRARVLGHVVVGDRDGEPLSVVREDSASMRGGATPLFLVGVAEEKLFWKDIRRVLFSRGRFTVLARIAQDGIRDSWTPIKLSHVLEEIVPGFSAQMNADSWKAMMTPAAVATRAQAKPLLRPPLLRFIELVAERAGAACPQERVIQAQESTAALSAEPFDFDTWRTETRRLKTVLLADSEVQLTPDEMETLRKDARLVTPAMIRGELAT
jgi:hypothetical protein